MKMDFDNLSFYINNDKRFCVLCLSTDEEVTIVCTSLYGSFLTKIVGLYVPPNGTTRSVCVWCLQRLRACMRLVKDAQKAQNFLLNLKFPFKDVSEVPLNEIQSVKMSKRFVTQTFQCSTVSEETENDPATNSVYIKIKQNTSWSTEEIDSHIDSVYGPYENVEQMQDNSLNCESKVFSNSKCNIKSPVYEYCKNYKDPLNPKRKKSKLNQQKHRNNGKAQIFQQLLSDNEDTKPFIKNEVPENYEPQVPMWKVPLSDKKQIQSEDIRVEIKSNQKEIERPEKNMEIVKKYICKGSTLKQQSDRTGEKKARSFLTKDGKRKKIGPYYQWSECRDYVELQPMTVSEQAAVREQRRRDAAYVAAPYKCDPCALAFPYTDSYTHHMQKHDPSYAPYKCPICKIYSRKTPANHAACAHRQRYVCTPCGFYARTRHVVIKHFLKKHSELILTCQMCRQVFKEIKEMKNHGTKAHSISPNSTQCVHCCKRIKNLRALQQHLKLHGIGWEEPVSQFECDYCGARFSIKSQVYTHIQQLHTGGFSMCRLCDRTFKSQTILKQHNRRFHTDRDIKRFECDTCCKKFAVLSELRYHILWTHMRQGVSCPHCPKVFKTGYMQRAHIRFVHEHQKAAADKLCDICGKGFTAVSSLQRHAVIHTGERPYTCALCPATFTQSSACTTHHRLVHLKLKRQRKLNLLTQLNDSESVETTSKEEK